MHLSTIKIGNRNAMGAQKRLYRRAIKVRR